MQLNKRLKALEQKKQTGTFRIESSYLRKLVTEQGGDPDNFPVPFVGWSDQEIQDYLWQNVMRAANET